LSVAERRKLIGLVTGIALCIRVATRGFDNAILVVQALAGQHPSTQTIAFAGARLGGGADRTVADARALISIRAAVGMLSAGFEGAGLVVIVIIASPRQELISTLLIGRATGQLRALEFRGVAILHVVLYFGAIKITLSRC